MNFTILGGDLRSVYLCHRLLQDGHNVRTIGLELADIPRHCCSETLPHALRSSNCVILPIPSADGSLLRAPYSTVPLSAADAANALPHNIPIFGGAVTPMLQESFAAHGHRITDLLTIESLAVQNAALTAQCALRLILERIPYQLRGRSVLIIGAGRIGKLLALQLQNLGASVTLSARKASDRAWCSALGLQTASTHALDSVLPYFPIVVNTVPAPVLSRDALSLLPHGALLLELASKPGGFDPVSAEAVELDVVLGRGLPGKYVPQSAADAIAETIYQELER